MSSDAAGEARALLTRLRAALAAAADDAHLRRRAPQVSARCLIGIEDLGLLLDIRQGVIDMREGWPPLTCWDFALHGHTRAWQRHWQSPPPPGWHDLLALAKQGALRIEGNLHPFMIHLQYFKDLLALPRAARGDSA